MSLYISTSRSGQTPSKISTPIPTNMNSLLESLTPKLGMPKNTFYDITVDASAIAQINNSVLEDSKEELQKHIASLLSIVADQSRLLQLSRLKLNGIESGQLYTVPEPIIELSSPPRNSDINSQNKQMGIGSFLGGISLPAHSNLKSAPTEAVAIPNVLKRRVSVTFSSLFLYFDYILFSRGT